MRFEIAVALNYKMHIDMQIAGEGRLLAPSEASIIRHSLSTYFMHLEGPSRVALHTLYNSLRYAKLPYPIDAPDFPMNHVAVQVKNRLVLLYWNSTSSARTKWNLDVKNLDDYRSNEYKYKDGKDVMFDSCKINHQNISFLRVLGWNVFTDYKKITDLPTIDKGELDPRLFDYQVQGVRMLDAGFRLMADEQGLGKTAQVLQYINKEHLRKVLICCPASLKLNWRKEILMWTKTPDSQIAILAGTSPYSVNSKYTIINYDLLPYWREYLCRQSFEMCVADECHYVQSDRAQRTQAFTDIIKCSDDAIFISGTPFTSRPFQMYTALHNIAPKIFTSPQDYGNRFCAPTYKMGKLVYNGASNMDVLHKILMDGICIRRLKADVLKDLPDKMRVTVPMGMTAEEVKADREVYNQIVDLEKKIAGAKDPLGTMEWRKQIAYLRKKRDILNWISDFLETGEKLVVFGVHKMALDDIERKFKDISVRIDGSTPNVTRDKNVEKFQNDPSCRLFIGNVQAAGTGLTLTAASNALFVEFPWCASQVLQSEDRIHRIGAKNACTIYYMTCPDTIDETIVDIINNKARMHSHIFDGYEDNMLNDLRKRSLEYTPLFKIQ